MTTARKYRKLPVEITAAQWFENGDHPNDYDRAIQDPVTGVTITGEYRREHGWEGDVVRYFRNPEVPGDKQCEHCLRVMHIHGWIDTLEGGHTVCPGDYVITGVEGERYPCKARIFAATYEPVEEAGA